MTTNEVSFPSGKTTCAATLYLPETLAPHPVVVMGHGLGGTRDLLEPYARKFSAAGYACLVFDYRNFGDSGGSPRRLVDPAAQQADFRAAIAYAIRHKALDATRVIAWGSSFGGGHVISIAAGDEQLAAVIAQCPFTDGLASTRMLNVRSSLRVTVAGIRDVIAAVARRQPVNVSFVGPAGSASLMTSPDAEPGYYALLPDDHDWINETPARIVLRIPMYRPVSQANRVTCPLLVVVCTDDAVAPAAGARRAADRAPLGEAREYSCGHFDIYLGDQFDCAVADQIEFLKRHVPVVTEITM
ncbi:alpha/beta hydrolase (plasmid) [Rhodococcoides fascians A21d2]|uniref:alpha/beta hydrolase n=1 Tax=Rhodococcoides fascians TaxID=1828 RepID=UPI00068B4A93|nr:alpha/beta hydrolase [Rhodococcus fascians]QII03786.1 alpha/beta hydrolase [Rhodococcus fascians A21d2]